MFELRPEKLRVGMRTLKTSLSAGICIILFHFLGRGSPMLACLGAVFALRGDTSTSFYFGIRRVLVTLLAGLLAILLVWIKQMAPAHFFLVDLLGVMLIIVVFIVLCNFLDLSQAIVGGIAAFLVIYFNTPVTENITYTVQRLLDTLIGTLVAVGVNWLFPRKATSPPR